MFRTKDYEYMKVLDTQGRKIGYVKDVVMDFHNSVIKGFVISTNSLLSKNQCVLTDNIVSINKVMIIKNTDKCSFMCFKDIKDMEVFNLQGEMMGVLEDMLIEPYNFNIKGLIIASGLLHKLIYGKNIILPINCILGEDLIIHFGDDKRIKFKTIPHGIEKEDYYE